MNCPENQQIVLSNVTKIVESCKKQGKQFDKITIFMKKNKGKVNDQLEKKEDKEQYYLKLLFVQKVVR